MLQLLHDSRAASQRRTSSSKQQGRDYDNNKRSITWCTDDVMMEEQLWTAVQQLLSSPFRSCLPPPQRGSGDGTIEDLRWQEQQLLIPHSLSLEYFTKNLK
ncbi:hypothetical protein PIB30_055648 [Stylosanthes scabra]|uniref:Uncharacterized protein n=1 Tax=Stylosanthes scabra TaxID=79078 RepID=A0ABU6UIJ8_9FABA|nr:hypothetical protein [Stylosanthes scabra]